MGKLKDVDGSFNGKDTSAPIHLDGGSFRLLRLLRKIAFSLACAICTTTAGCGMLGGKRIFHKTDWAFKLALMNMRQAPNKPLRLWAVPELHALEGLTRQLCRLALL